MSVSETLGVLVLPAGSRPFEQPPIDLDAIKAAGLNSEAESQRLLAAHRASERQEVGANG